MVLDFRHDRAKKLTDTSSTSRIEFYGQSLPCDNSGEIVQPLDNAGNGLVTLSVDPSSIKQQQMAWGMSCRRFTVAHLSNFSPSFLR